MRFPRLLAAAAAGLALSACGGGGSDNAAANCVTGVTANVPGAANLLALPLANDTDQPRRFKLSGQVRFAGQAAPEAIGYSTLLLTDGQSPVEQAVIRTPAGGRAQGLAPLAGDVILPPRSTATWLLATTPLPAPGYGWTALTFSGAELCAE